MQWVTEFQSGLRIAHYACHIGNNGLSYGDVFIINTLYPIYFSNPQGPGNDFLPGGAVKQNKKKKKSSLPSGGAAGALLISWRAK